MAENQEEEVGRETSEALTVKLISEVLVKPKQEVEEWKKQPHCLGPIDLALLTIDPIQTGLLFPLDAANPPAPAVSSLVDSLRESLSLALVHFYPLAGRLAVRRYEDEGACWVHVDCGSCPGARLVHAAARPGLSVADILSPADVPREVRSFFGLGERMSPNLGPGPLLAVQVTELRDGVFVGFSLNHAVGDGTSLDHFIGVLSEIFGSVRGGERGGCALPPSRAPVFELFCPEGYGPVIKLPCLEPERLVARRDPGPLRERIFRFSAASMAGLKARANQEQGPCERCDCGSTSSNNSSNKGVVSSFMALSALVWRSITRARGPPPPDHGTSFYLMVNARPRLDPPVSDNYFGNVLCPCKVPCTVGELLSNPLGWAAGLLGRAVGECTHHVIHDVWRFWADHFLLGQARPGGPEHGLPCHSVTMGGSARFDAYGPEFGLGRAVAVLMGYGNKADGKVTANPGPEGGGSVDLEICLAPESMSALEADEEFMSFVSLGRGIK